MNEDGLQVNDHISFSTTVEESKEENKVQKDSVYEKWMSDDNINFIPIKNDFFVDELPPGIYEPFYNSNIGKYVFKKNQIFTDELYLLPNGIFEKILNDLKYFWEHPEKFDEYGYNHKRGILLFGSPGNGKTCLTNLIAKQIEKQNGIIFNIKDVKGLDAYKESISSYFRQIQPITPVVVILEDLDSLVSYPESESLLLNILDGFNQLQHVVYIGCTNYPEKLKERILNRPSRFDKRYYIEQPDRKVREFYLKKKILPKDLKNIDLNEILDKTEGLSLSHLGELIKAVFIFGSNFDDTIDELKGMGEYISSSQFTKKSNTVGFKK